MINGVPEKVTNYNVYDSANDEERLIGVGSELTLPSLEAMTETISGAGLLGEYDSTTPGHFSALDFELPFRIMTGQMFRIAAGDSANLTIRASMQYNDVATGQLVQEGVRINVRGDVKAFNPGTIGVAKPGEASVTVGVVYYKITGEKNNTLLELDKHNFVYIVNGEDKLAAIRDRI